MKDTLNKVHCLDCIEFLKKLPDNSVDSCVTDPPYGLQFMGVRWDTFRESKGRDARAAFDKVGGHHHATSPQDSVRTKLVEGNRMQQWHYDWAVEVFRILKHGAHLLAFSGTRTYHRLACAIEDAGFEIRDQIHWLYGSGFPKGQNISKAIDKRKGIKGDVIAIGHSGKKRSVYRAGTDDNPDWFGGPYDITAPSTDEAQQWQGWNTQLKPAHEPIVLARKPISEKSIVDNVLKHGTGAINIDACRIAVSPDVDAVGKTTKRGTREAEAWREGSGFKNPENPIAGVLPSGRYPANLILSHHPDCKLVRKGQTTMKMDSVEANVPLMGGKGIYGGLEGARTVQRYAGKPEVWACVEGCPVRILNEQSGDRSAGGAHTGHTRQMPFFDHEMKSRHKRESFSDSGGAARFFYCAKPSVAERSAGLKDKRNKHLTVKPVQIMRWLVRLVTPRGGIVLDPFLGSGTTAIAAENEGCNWLACDNNEEYCKIAEARIEALGGTQTTLEDHL